MTHPVLTSAYLLAFGVHKFDDVADHSPHPTPAKEGVVFGGDGGDGGDGGGAWLLS